VLTGLAISGLAILIAGRTDDHLIQITLTTVVAYASFLVAEHFHASGIIAALTAGLTIGRFSKNVFPDEEGPLVRSIWEYIAFLANSLIFILIGMNEANQPLREFVSLAALGAIALVLLGRAISIYPLAFMFSRSRWRLPMPYQHVLFWGGLKGALALALALAVPASVPERNTIIIAAFLVVAFSILVQGLTMPRLLKWYDLREPHEGSSR
jgi:CPA1 family monovalent cation:H+ antiporter